MSNSLLGLRSVPYSRGSNAILQSTLHDFLDEARSGCTTQYPLSKTEARSNASALCNLSRCYLAIYLFSSRQLRTEDLDCSISIVEDGISLSSNLDVDQSYYILQWAFALVIRYTVTQVEHDLHQAIGGLKQVIESLPNRSPLMPRCLGLLGLCRLASFKVHQYPRALDQAIISLYQALICRPEDTRRRSWSNSLGLAEHYDMHGLNGAVSKPNHDQTLEYVVGDWHMNDSDDGGGSEPVETLFDRHVPYCIGTRMEVLEQVFEAALNYGNKRMCIKLLDEASGLASSIFRNRFEWIAEPLSMGFTSSEVVELLIERTEQSPWICYALEQQQPELGSMIPDYHRPGCIHRCLLQPDRLIQSSADLTSRFVKRRISEMCGLAGIVPGLNDKSLWNGRVEFCDDSSSAKITYGAPEGISFTSKTETYSRALSQCCGVLDKVVKLTSWLQREGAVCDHLIILAHNLRTDRLRSTSISFRLVEKLRACLEVVTSARSPGDLNAYAEILDIAVRILASTSVLRFMPESLQNEQIIDYALDSSAIAVQMICIGFLSFSQAHIGDLRPFFLEISLSKVSLGGIGGQLSQDLNLSLSPTNLSCIGDMLGCSVLAFMAGRTSTIDKIYDFQTSAKALSDLWGPIELKQDYLATTSTVTGIKIGGGVISKVSQDSSMFHWSPETSEILLPRFSFETSDIIIIGSLYGTNQECPAVPNQHSTVPRKNIHKEIRELGTWPETFDLQQIQAGFQTGQFFNPTFNTTWIKRDCRSRKKKGLEDVTLDFLEQPWGLLVSVCTGVAHQVPLREAVAEVMTPMMAAWMEKPVEWPALSSNGSGILSEMKKSTFRSWVASLSSEEQHAVSHCVRYVLRKLCWTGVNDKGKLVMSCPSFEQSDGCVHVSLRDNHALAGILKDTEYSATFVCLTTKCFIITDQVYCQWLGQPMWKNQIPFLVTSVCQYKWLGADDWDLLPRKDLENGKLYWMGSRQDKARFVAEVNGRQGSSTVLKLSTSQTP